MTSWLVLNAFVWEVRVIAFFVFMMRVGHVVAMSAPLNRPLQSKRTAMCVFMCPVVCLFAPL